MKEYEEKILSAEEKIYNLEFEILNSLKKEILSSVEYIQNNAKVLSRIDIAAALAKLAIAKDYNRPLIDNSKCLEIRNGRHPVVEDLLPIGQDFIPNDYENSATNLIYYYITYTHIRSVFPRMPCLQ